ncbi:hypothetical protein [Roseimaritima ulvae]|uniref:Uncharacterized protein n=1 Tax=Roseimaritima ulvae TaxID=980254 RepID=A0A5B9QNN2_9BACT|nr:hypothetical protein [Roseimaritima ulvae]QEG39270.1 hypothetical protein UC8_12310 [Roseimaritima ulvae]
MYRAIAMAIAVLFSSIGSAAVAQEPTAEADLADRFYQEVEVQRKPSFDIQGVRVAQHIHYRVLSYFVVQPANARGDRTVVQEIRDTQLVQADALSQRMFPAGLAELKGKRLTFVFDSGGRIIEYKGPGQPAQAAEVGLPGASGVLVSSVMDDDGWKELATFTMFQPPQEAPQGQPFQYTTRHDWGSLGSWYGDTKVTYGKRRGAFQQFAFVHELDYIPPAAGAKTDLPFSIQDAAFKTVRADANIVYDTRAERIAEAREWFTVTGIVQAKMLGSEIKVQLQEQQMMTIRMKTQPFRLR